MKSRLVVLAVVAAAFAARTPTVQAAAPRPMQPEYLREMPSVERVKAEVRGRDRMDTAARQMGAFWQLRRIIETLAGPRLYRSTTPDERRLIGEYSVAYSSISQAIERSLSQKDRPAWFGLHTRYELDRAFREELLTRFFSQKFRDGFRQAEAQELARARARADQQRARPTPAPRSSVSLAPAAFVGLLALAVVMFVARRRRARSRGAHPNTAETYYELGVTYYDAKQYADAIESFKESIAAGPSTAAYNDLGNAYFALKQYDEAVAAYQDAIRLKPDNALAYFGLGRSYSESKDYEKAISAFREAVRIKPDLAGAWFMLGGSHYAVGQYPEAETALQRVIRLASNKAVLPAAYSLLGDVYVMTGKAEEALQICSALARIDAKAAVELETQARIVRGSQYYQAKEYAKAAESYKKVIALDPGPKTLARVYRLLGLALNQASQYEDAILALKDALRLEPNNEEIHFGLGWTYVEAKRYSDALPALEAAVRLKPDDAETHYWIGEVYCNGMNQPEQALAAYRESLRLRPDDARTHNQIGLVQTGLEEFTEAEAAFKQAIRLKPDVALYHSNLGLLYARMDDMAGALRVLQTLEKMDSGKATQLRDAITP